MVLAKIRIFRTDLRFSIFSDIGSYVLNHRIGGLLFHYKKILSGNWLLFFGKSIQRHPDSVCENDVNN